MKTSHAIDMALDWLFEMYCEGHWPDRQEFDEKIEELEKQ